MLTILIAAVIALATGVAAHLGTQYYYTKKIELLEANHKKALAKEFTDSYGAGYNDGELRGRQNEELRQNRLKIEARKNQQ